MLGAESTTPSNGLSFPAPELIEVAVNYEVDVTRFQPISDYVAASGPWTRSPRRPVLVATLKAGCKFNTISTSFAVQG